MTLTYNGEDKILGGVTYGGYSETIVVDEDYGLRVPADWSRLGVRRCSARESPPTRRCGTGRWATGRRSGIVGLGGLGHMGVKFAQGVRRARRPVHHSPKKAEDARGWARTK